MLTRRFARSLAAGGSNGHSFVTGNFDPLEAVLGVFPAVRIRGLPFTATLEDVLIFFQGLVVVDVVLDKVKNEGVVLFANPMDFQMALGRDKQHMGRRYIEVFQGKRIEVSRGTLTIAVGGTNL